jgi:hypothetical protein
MSAMIAADAVFTPMKGMAVPAFADVAKSEALSPARAELARLSDQLSAAKAEHEKVQQPVSRLRAAIDGHREAEAERAVAQGEYETLLAAWLAGGEGSRPQPPTRLLAAEHRVRETLVDAEAAERALPPLEAAAQAAIDLLGRLSIQYRQATWRAAVEAAGDYARSTWLPTMVEAVKASAPLESLKAEFQRAAHHGDGSRYGGAQRAS